MSLPNLGVMILFGVFSPQSAWSVIVIWTTVKLQTLFLHNSVFISDILQAAQSPEADEHSRRRVRPMGGTTPLFSDKELAMEHISKQINKNNSYTPWQSTCGGNENIYPQIITDPSMQLPYIQDQRIRNTDCMFRGEQGIWQGWAEGPLFKLLRVQLLFLHLSYLTVVK